jgi:hypothetical protein
MKLELFVTLFPEEEEEMELSIWPSDILSLVLQLLPVEDVSQLIASGDKRLSRRLRSEPLLPSLTITSPHFPLHRLPSDFSPLVRLKIDIKGDLLHRVLLWIDPRWLPPTLIDLDLSFAHSLLIWLHRVPPGEQLPWLLTSPESFLAPVFLCDFLPALKRLKLFGFEDGDSFSVEMPGWLHRGENYDHHLHAETKIFKPGKDNVKSGNDTVPAKWTLGMLFLFLMKLPLTLETLEIPLPGPLWNFIPFLPPKLTSLMWANPMKISERASGRSLPGEAEEQEQESRFTSSSCLRLPPPDLSRLSEPLLWDIPTTDAVMKMASFDTLRALDMTGHFLDRDQLKLLPRQLLQLSITLDDDEVISDLNYPDMALLPRSITHLTLEDCPWTDDDNTAFGKNFCSFLPPHLTYLRLNALYDWLNENTFGEMNSTLRGLQTLLLGVSGKLTSFAPWLPCDSLHTLEIYSSRSSLYSNELGSSEHHILSTWPTDIPNNISRLRLGISSSGPPTNLSYPPNVTDLDLHPSYDIFSPSLKIPSTLTRLKQVKHIFKTDAELVAAFADSPKLRILEGIDCYLSDTYIPSGAETVSEAEIRRWQRSSSFPALLRQCTLIVNTNTKLPKTVTKLDLWQLPNLTSPIKHLAVGHLDVKSSALLTGLESLVLRPPAQIASTVLSLLTCLTSLEVRSASAKISICLLPATITSLTIPNFTQIPLNAHAKPNTATKSKTKSTTKAKPLPLKIARLIITEENSSITQAQLEVLAPYLQELKVGCIHLHDLSIYASLPRHLVEFTPLALVQTFCPRLVTLGPETIQIDYRPLQQNATTLAQDIKHVSSLPPTLTTWSTNFWNSKLGKLVPQCLKELTIRRLDSASPPFPSGRILPQLAVLKLSLVAPLSSLYRVCAEFYSSLPRSLTTLELQEVNNLDIPQLRALPPDLLTLIAPSLTIDISFSNLRPQGLTTLKVAVASLKSLDHLPPGITHLHVGRFSQLDSVVKLSDLASAVKQYPLTSFNYGALGYVSMSWDAAKVHAKAVEDYARRSVEL